MRLAALFAALGLVACSSSTQTVHTGPCAQRDGTYVVDYTMRSGNCGPQSETVLVLHESAQSLPDTCKGSVDTAADNCSTDADYTCSTPTLGAGRSTRLAGRFDWASDGSGGSGTIELTVYDASGVIVCDGSYDAQFTKKN